MPNKKIGITAPISFAQECLVDRIRDKTILNFLSEFFKYFVSDNGVMQRIVREDLDGRPGKYIDPNCFE